MQFKNLATFAAIASMAVMGNAVAVERRGIADCVYELTATTPVPAGTDLQLDWNYLLGYKLAAAFSGHIIGGGNATFTGPDANNAYTIEQLFDVPTISTASLLAEINGWLGQTFSGPWSGVDYILTNVSC